MKSPRSFFKAVSLFLILFLVSKSWWVGKGTIWGTLPDDGLKDGEF